MVLFEDDNKLRKFKNIDDILSCFISKRYDLYVKRKKSMISNLQNELDDLKVEHLFIRRVINDEIVIFRKSNDEIVEQLENYDFEMKDESYDYLLGIKISKFSKSELVKLEKKIEQVKKELERIKGTSEKDMWIGELKELEAKL
jgi:DNA gyrase/topoisomerase IV subunit A